jgi:hypothetical protein
MTALGLPHSDISGSSLLSSSPKLFAAWHVLHRLWNQGIHLHALNYFQLTQNCTTLNIVQASSARACRRRSAFMCLATHESSSLYSFQRSRCRRRRCSQPHVHPHTSAACASSATRCGNDFIDENRCANDVATSETYSAGTVERIASNWRRGSFPQD